ncbi:MAG: DNA mismatch endonuclease Vsr [Bryobacteraceae bacterium]|nr:DNA mismatch endonuclease Vsr [Bryobacteraceae bacterium]
MADIFSKEKRSAVMAAVRPRGNKDTELKLVAILRRHGITGWRRHRPLPGKPDFIFPQARLAGFVDGCFWHGCPKHCRMPATNVPYWRRKVARNRERDRAVNRMIRGLGWQIMRIWEHSLRSDVLVAKRIRMRLSCPAGAGKLARKKSG